MGSVGGLGAGFKRNHIGESRVPPPHPVPIPEASYSKVFLGPRIYPKTLNGIASTGYTMDPRNGYCVGPYPVPISVSRSFLF